MEKRALTSARRVFIGIPAGEALQKCAASFRREHEALPVRWVKPENLHLTLVPPWQCEDPETICKALYAVASCFSGMDVLFSAVTAAPHSGMPRFLWATGSAPALLTELKNELGSTVLIENSGEREFFMHLTLGRIRHENQDAFTGKRLNIPVSWSVRFRKVCLFESLLKPAGAEYRVLCDARFRGKTQKS